MNVDAMQYVELYDCLIAHCCSMVTQDIILFCIRNRPGKGYLNYISSYSSSVGQIFHTFYMHRKDTTSRRRHAYLILILTLFNTIFSSI